MVLPRKKPPHMRAEDTESPPPGEIMEQRDFANAKSIQIIDQLISAGVGKYVKLPQVVAVGDQSCGKSSVLASLTGIDFPRSNGLCTRFPTMITFRRAEKTALSVSIIPEDNSDQKDIDRLKDWKKKKNFERLDANTFAEIMEEVYVALQIKDANGNFGKTTFARDVLKLEISGPEEEHFSIIDVPGIFRVEDPGITTKADKKMVKAMVEDYMQNSFSVILTVIPANVDIATQEIVEMAKKHDPDRNRTIGVLTKPDLVDECAEEDVMSLVMGGRHKLKLGWYITRNLAQKQLSDKTIDPRAVELEFFKNKEPWCELNKARVGVMALKRRLSSVFGEVTKKHLPEVKRKIIKQLEDAQADLERLGSTRQTESDQLRYLLRVSKKFETLVKYALTSSYVDDAWFDKGEGHPEERRLATFIAGCNERLVKNLRELGHTYQFTQTGKTEGSFTDTNEASRLKIDTSVNSNSLKRKADEAGLEDEGRIAKSALRSECRNPELEPLGILNTQLDVPKPKGGILKWILEELRSSRGFGLEACSTDLLKSFMKAQSKNWERIALEYIREVISASHTFIKEALTEVCHDDSVRDELLHALMKGLMERYKTAVDNVHFLLKTEREIPLTTEDRSYLANLSALRHDRGRDKAMAKSFTLSAQDPTLVVSLEECARSDAHQFDAAFKTEECHDILMSYYGVALLRFIENLTRQPTLYHLMCGDDTPLGLFGTEFVAELPAGQLATICEEDSFRQDERAGLIEKIKKLEQAKAIIY